MEGGTCALTTPSVRCEVRAKPNRERLKYEQNRGVEQRERARLVRSVSVKALLMYAFNMVAARIAP